MAVPTENVFLFDHNSKSLTYPFILFVTMSPFLLLVSALIMVGSFHKLNSLQQQKSVQVRESESET